MNNQKAESKARDSYHHGDLRNALIRAGMEIIEEKGLPGLSLRAIAARAGVSHTAPRNHFGSLKGLLTAIGAEGFRLHAEAMREGISDTSKGRERLSAAMRGYADFATRHPALFSMMFSPEYCEFQNEELIANARASYAILEDISRDLDWVHADSPDAALRAEMMLWSLVHGYATLRLAGQFRTPDGSATPFGIADILPDFTYRES